MLKSDIHFYKYIRDRDSKRPELLRLMRAMLDARNQPAPPPRQARRASQVPLVFSSSLSSVLAGPAALLSAPAAILVGHDDAAMR